jgi:hypothetical protein
MELAATPPASENLCAETALKKDVKNATMGTLTITMLA